MQLLRNVIKPNFHKEQPKYIMSLIVYEWSVISYNIYKRSLARVS